jgi:hypothetical protein
MSSSLSGLLSATFVEPGYEHLVELVHQRDADARRRLRSLDVSLHAADGKRLAEIPVDSGEEILDLAALVRDAGCGADRVLAVFDARYDERVFPYRPHHYAYLHRAGSEDAALYYAMSAALGGVPDRLGEATRLTNFETYVFPPRPFDERYSVLIGNLSRFAPAQARVVAYYGEAQAVQQVELAPKAHVEVAVPAEHAGRRLERVELKSLFRLASYVVGRRADTGSFVLFDHLFTYFK